MSQFDGQNCQACQHLYEMHSRGIDGPCRHNYLGDDLCPCTYFVAPKTITPSSVAVDNNKPTQIKMVGGVLTIQKLPRAANIDAKQKVINNFKSIKQWHRAAQLINGKFPPDERHNPRSPVFAIKENLQSFRHANELAIAKLNVVPQYNLAWSRTIPGLGELMLERKDVEKQHLKLVLQNIKKAAKECIRIKRASRKTCVEQQQKFRSGAIDNTGRRGAYIMYSGGLPRVYGDEPRILKMQADGAANKIFEQKSPRTSEKHFGIEIECVAKTSRTNLGAALVSAGLANWVTLKSDGSIDTTDTHGYAHELNVCVPESRLHEIINKVCAVLAQPEIDATVNKSCGLHVHLDCRDGEKTAADVFNRLCSAQRLLMDMQPPSRRDNQYCKVIRRMPFYKAAQAENRYFAVNATAFRKYKTVEVRCGASSVDAEKIINWSLFLSAIAYKAAFKRAPRSFTAWVKVINLSGPVSSWALARLQSHSPSSYYLTPETRVRQPRSAVQVAA